MANGTFDITQTDAQLQAILNKIQPLVNTAIRFFIEPP